MEKKRFSIIIPHYNSFESLKRLIKSIPRDENIEIIIVDDRSTGNEFDKICMFYKNENNIKILKNHTQKKGAGVCRNMGLDRAQGKWLIFADADDFFTENAFLDFGRYYDSQAEIIYFNCESIYEDTKKKAKRHITFRNLILQYLEEKTEFREKKLRYEFIVPWSKMILNDLVIKNHIRFDEVMVSNDVMFSVKTGLKAKKIEASKDKVYCVTRNNNSLTSNRNESDFDGRLEIHLKKDEFLKENNELIYCPYFLTFILWSGHYGYKKIYKVIKLVFRKKLKIFPNEFFKNIFNGFYFLKILEKIKDKKYSKQ